jgi:hypothetical protein
MLTTRPGCSVFVLQEWWKIWDLIRPTKLPLTLYKLNISQHRYFSLEDGDSMFLRNVGDYLRYILPSMQTVITVCIDGNIWFVISKMQHGTLQFRNYLRVYTMSQCRKTSSSSPPWEPQISNVSWIMNSALYWNTVRNKPTMVCLKVNYPGIHLDGPGENTKSLDHDRKWTSRFLDLVPQNETLELVYWPQQGPRRQVPLLPWLFSGQKQALTPSELNKGFKKINYIFMCSESGRLLKIMYYSVNVITCSQSLWLRKQNIPSSSRDRKKFYRFNLRIFSLI